MAWKGDNTNPAPNNIQEKSNVSDKRSGNTIDSTSNRAHNIRRDLDEVKDFTVTLIDIDKTILEYIDKTIEVHVLDNSDNIKVPIIYASPERWKAIQKDGYLRDSQGKLQFPIISFSRTSVAKRQDMMTPNRHLTYPVLQKFSEKNKYNPRGPTCAFDPPTHQIWSVTLPDHITATYSFLCQTEYVEQMNTIIEKINWAAEDYWGDPKRFRFKVAIGDYNTTTETPEENDRIVKTEFSITVNAYLLDESFESRKRTTQKILTPRKIIVGTEIILNGKMMEEKTKLRGPFPYSYTSDVVKRDGVKFEQPTVRVLDFVEIKGIQNSYESMIEFLPPSHEIPGVATFWHNPPTLSSDPGEEGWMAYDNSYHYVYTNNRWLRHALSDFQQF